MLQVLRKAQGADMTTNIEKQKADLAAWLAQQKPASLVQIEQRQRAVRDELGTAKTIMQSLITESLKNNSSHLVRQMQEQQVKIREIEDRLSPLRIKLREEREAFAANLGSRISNHCADDIGNRLMALAQEVSEIGSLFSVLKRFCDSQGIGMDMPRFWAGLPDTDGLIALARRYGSKE